LKHHQVEPLNTIGQPLDADTCDVAGSEASEGVPAGVVLRELQIGYTWPQGLLRRAKVVVSSGSPSSAQGAENTSPGTSEAKER